MNIEETHQIIFAYLVANHPFLNHTHNTALIYGGVSYRIEPDDAFYYQDNILLVEYENNKRPVESISKYYWLFKNTNWLEAGLKIKLLLTINKGRINAIRTETIKILGDELTEKYPSKFNFCFIEYNALNEETLISELENLTINE
jgi:ribosomal protein S17E